MRVATRAIRLSIAAFALLMLGSSVAVGSPAAASKSVNIQNFAFNPTPVTINVGESVTWTNLDQAVHSAASASFDTKFLNQGQSKTITFGTAGIFDYICGVHGASMSGRVVVLAAATGVPTQPPTPATSRPTVAPTAVPTNARTAVPTLAPTLEPSPEPTASPSPTPSPSPREPTATPTAAAAATVIVAASPTPGPSSAPATPDDTPLLVAGGVVALAAVAGAAVFLLRR